MKRVGVGWLWLLGVLLMADPAAAQNGLGVFAGQATGHIGVAAGSDGQGSTLSLGASVAVVDDSGWGAEFDFGYADDDDGRTGGLDAQSYVISAIGIWPKGRIRPFVVGGGGVVRARTCTADCSRIAAWTDWAISGGGGVQYRLNPASALTADVRYFSVPGTNPDHPNGLGFWRVSIGATFLWDEP
jgi:hypothetical protein